jgi:uncharacterized membrane protein YgdD (TMEM256/DUF423 family)
MQRVPSPWMTGALLGGTAVLLGAFGAHGLERSVDDPALLQTWRTAAHYQLVHAVVLLACACHPRKPVLAPRLITAGVLVFSGSLYALVLTGVRALGAITPIGGLLLIAGWLALAFASRPLPPWDGAA